jgi:hypothetical protein
MTPDNTSPAANTWAERIDRFRTADMTVAQFCNAEGVTQAAYYYWRRKILGNPKVTGKKLPAVTRRFVPVALADPSPSKPATVMAVELPGGVRIRFEVTSDPRGERA